MRLTRITLLLITLIMGAGFYRLSDYLLEDLETQTLQATEESMIDAAHILANLTENDLDLEQVFARIDERKLNAKIFVIAKEKIGLNAYLTDQNGIVLFDSGQPENVGKNFSEWSDVYKTLRGKYGARSTREDESESDSSVMFVGAPVRKDGKNRRLP
jgi:two-component system sensor histidine kinase CreC